MLHGARQPSSSRPVHLKTSTEKYTDEAKTYSVTVIIPADSSRYSKLALYGDYKRFYVKVEEKDWLGRIVKTTYHYTYEPTSNHYLRVIYQ
ncbi:hypothetical protein J2S00_001222 [Caldalkalibacillus uzonensis]|uniref:Uncharacterized protein n=1 Tax=Caldalkalibacillus uzonensis TaxID=353224 RepID=A0ABU0CPT9_9BACI|nr:hypothetical protein [Caldalkalibacillus uzonensis]